MYTDLNKLFTTELEMPTIRIKDDTLDMMNTLREGRDFKDHKTHNDLINHLVKLELMDKFAHTQDGYLPVGSVVSDGDTILTITSVINGRVIFDDMSYANNGSRVIYRLRLVAKSIEEYEGGRISG